jgi:phage terminase large subunit-like protein
MVENREIQACKEQHLLVAYIRKCFKTEPIYTDETQLKKYLNMAKYFPYVELFEWEVFVLALHCCTYRKKDRRPRWPDLFALMGRGAGKDGFIAFVDFCLASPHNGINAYNIDMVANNEKQAKAPFDDIYSVLTNPDNTEKLRKFFYWNKEVIKCRQTGAEIQFHTNNPKGKDGLRPGYIVFNEIHQYENYDNINVFTTALGKKPHPRRAYITTNGEVRDGPLDHLLERCLGILEKGDADNGMLPFICRLDEKEEVHNFNMWEKANPSLRYRPDLREEMEKEYRDWLVNPFFFTDFMKKRMNMPGGKKEEQVTSWELIKASCSPVPKERLRGRSAVAGIDYAMISDFASAGILLREGDKRYWITHSWLCEQSKDIPRLKCPYKDWARQGFLTLVSDVEIHPDYITEWIMKQALQFNITKLAMDHHRFALLAKSLAGAGYDPKGEKNLKLVRPSDIMMVAPVIDSCFNNELFAWGDNPVMRWAVNNTKKIRSGVRTGNDTGNYVYGKIEAKSRKTDPFLALVAAMTIEGEIEEEAGAFEDIPVITA